MGKRKVDSSEDDEEENISSDDAEPLLGKKKTTSFKGSAEGQRRRLSHQSDEEDDGEDEEEDEQEMVEEDEDGEGSEPDDDQGKDVNGKHAENGSKNEAEWSGSDEEERFMRIMQQHTTPTSSPNKARFKAAASAKTVALGTGKASKGLDIPSSAVDDGIVDVVVAAGKSAGRAEQGGSRIKFSKSVQLVVPNLKKISRTTFMLQCEDPAFDVEGDSGVIGTLKSSDSALQLDIKGQLYEGSVVPTNSMFVVDLGASECRVEAVMNDFVQLKPIANPHGEDMDVSDSDYDLPRVVDESDDERPKKGKKNSKGDGTLKGTKKTMKKQPSKKSGAKRVSKK